MGKPFDTMLGVVGVKDRVDVLDPRFCFCRVAQRDTGWSIPIESRDAFALDQTTVDHDTVFNEHRLTGAPSRLLDAAMFIQPFGSGLVDEVTVLVALGSAACGEHLLWSQASIDACTDTRTSDGSDR
jgi:hypothetical protein